MKKYKITKQLIGNIIYLSTCGKGGNGSLLVGDEHQFQSKSLREQFGPTNTSSSEPTYF